MKQFKRIYVEITNFCNLNCSFCAKSNRVKNFIKTEDFEYIISSISKYTDYVYLHVLGEPLLHPELDKLLSICENYNLNVNITTNGTLLNKQLPILLKHKIRQFNISLHCEDNMSDNSYFESVFSACDKLSENSFISYRSWIKDDKGITNEILKHYNINIENKYKQTISKNIFFSIDQPFEWEGNENDDTGNCYGLKTMCAILVDGTVTACCIDYDGKINLGNIFKTPFEQIVTSEKFVTIKQALLQNKFICDTCKKCNYKKRFK